MRRSSSPPRPALTSSPATRTGAAPATAPPDSTSGQISIVWECPEGQHLHRVETDHRRRLARYRASPQICNACPAKAECTDSDQGREIVESLDPWPHSEAGRFHRGVCVVLVALAALISAIALVRSDGTGDLVALSASLGLSVAFGGRLLATLRRTPSGFPAPPEESIVDA